MFAVRTVVIVVIVSMLFFAQLTSAKPPSNYTLPPILLRALEGQTFKVISGKHGLYVLCIIVFLQFSVV